MHYLYILKSKASGKYYIGETDNVQRRLKQHRDGKTSFGCRNSDVILVYEKEFGSRSQARKLESFLKRQKSHLFIDRFLAGKITFPLSSVGRARGC